MRKRKSIRKPEPVDVRGMCAVPGCTNPQVSNGKGKFKAVCNAHHRIRTKSQYAYLAFRRDYCEHCGFLQTEEPYWLDEAYSESINVSDTGYMQRNLMLSEKLTILLALFFDKNAKFLDYGGGYGIFTRLNEIS